MTTSAIRLSQPCTQPIVPPRGEKPATCCPSTPQDSVSLQGTPSQPVTLKSVGNWVKNHPTDIVLGGLIGGLGAVPGLGVYFNLGVGFLAGAHSNRWTPYLAGIAGAAANFAAIINFGSHPAISAAAFAVAAGAPIYALASDTK